MPLVINTFFKLLALIGGVIVGIRLVLLLWSVPYAESIVAASREQRLRVIGAYERITRSIKLVLWEIPLVAIALPVAIHFFTPEIDALVAFIALAELAVLVATEFFFERWLLGYVGRGGEQ